MLPGIAVLAADGSRVPQMLVLVGIAVVLVSPFAVKVGGRILRERRQRRQSLVETPSGPDPERSIDPSDLGSVVAEVEARAAGSEPFEVVIPDPATVDGVLIGPEVAEAILANVAARRGLRVLHRTTSGGSTRLRLGPAEPSP